MEGRGGENQEIFKCNHCELTSPFKVVISRHLRTHKEERGWRCEECGNCYVNEHGLKRHKRLNHGGLERVNCPFCNKEFGNGVYMRAHVRLHCKVKKKEERGNGGREQEDMVVLGVMVQGENGGGEHQGMEQGRGVMLFGEQFGTEEQGFLGEEQNGVGGGFEGLEELEEEKHDLGTF